MTNSERFRNIFGVYATEIWALPEEEFLQWFNSEEQKTGKWIEVDDFYNRIRGRCSECGLESHMYEDDVVGMDYCPNCGARLENGGDV